MTRTARLPLARHQRLGTKLLLVTLAVLAGGYAASSAFTVRSERALLSRELDSRGESLARLAAKSCIEPLTASDYPVLVTFIEELASQDADVVLARVVRTDGKTVAEASDQAQGTRFESQHRIYGAPVVVRDDAGGEAILGRVELGISTARLDALTHERARVLAIAAAGPFAALALLFGLLLRRAVTRPLQALDAQAQRLGTGDMETPIALDCSDELGRLAGTLEGMRVSLRASSAEVQRKHDELSSANALQMRTLRELKLALEQAHAAARAKVEFLTTISHELRTPMNAMLGMTDLLLETPLSSEQRELADAALGSGRALQSVVDDILDFAKLDAGTLRPCDSEFDPRALMDTVGKGFAALIEQKGLAFSSWVERGAPALLRADHERVRQVLWNLVSNAIKFTTTGGIEISLRVLAAPTGECLEFRVNDTGIGVPPESTGKLFQPFSQVDGSSSRSYGGTGLGLAICKRSVDLLGGTIGYESEPGKGSSFWFRLPLGTPALAHRAVSAPPDTALAQSDPAPLARLQAPEPPPVLPAQRPEHRGRILVVEDNVINQRLMLQLLKKRGYESALAHDGRQALKLVEREQFELVLMDCSMPVMDGYQATAEIRRREVGGSRRLPIVAVTANAMDGDRERCFAVGMDAFLPKPLVAAELYKAIEQQLSGRPQAA